MFPPADFTFTGWLVCSLTVAALIGIVVLIGWLT